ncbi:hypothetical protein Scani_01830 [Streptomyces caniferus]|uniref:Tyr recombinase domain-containing protein n=1 Tax=Streptomyces caniferus TaxID=285557 RepID=A0A640S2R5_9ACTN|nr:hypothetical protein Scani_01830 [Streptomyces caniferus]
MNTGRRAEGDTKSVASVRTSHLPTFLAIEVKRHLEWFAEKAPDGLLFVGEKGAPFRRIAFGHKWAKARAAVRLPEASASMISRTPATPSAPSPGHPQGHDGPRRPVLGEGRDDLPALRRPRQQEVAGGIDARVRAARR